MFEFDISLNELLFNDLPCKTFSQRLSKAKSVVDYSQRTLSEATGLSLSTINELEAGYRDNISRCTLNKLLTVLDEKILCDDYCNFILNQENEVKKILHIYNINILSNLLKVHRSTIERWCSGKYQISRKQYELIQMLIADEH
jgi:DNA-binding XRE family transcriptional regulator